MKKLLILVIGLAIQVTTYAVQDWNEDGSTMSCAWAKDIPGAAFVKGKGTPTVTLNFYADNTGRNLIKTLKDDHNFYFAVAKKGQFVKLKLNGKIMGWVPESQIQFGALRNCNF